VPEKPFRLGDTIANELVPGDSSQKKSGAVLDIEAEIKLAFDSRRDSEDSASFARRIKCLGLQRSVTSVRKYVQLKTCTRLFFCVIICRYWYVGQSSMVGRTIMCSPRPWGRWSSTACERYDPGGYDQAEHHREHTEATLPGLDTRQQVSDQIFHTSCIVPKLGLIFNYLSFPSITLSHRWMTSKPSRSKSKPICTSLRIRVHN
jgi:hypothetical protein